MCCSVLYGAEKGGVDYMWDLKVSKAHKTSKPQVVSCCKDSIVAQEDCQVSVWSSYCLDFDFGFVVVVWFQCLVKSHKMTRSTSRGGK